MRWDGRRAGRCVKSAAKGTIRAPSRPSRPSGTVRRSAGDGPTSVRKQGSGARRGDRAYAGGAEARFRRLSASEAAAHTVETSAANWRRRQGTGAITGDSAGWCSTCRSRRETGRRSGNERR
jgi:hypothetical protein